MKEFPLTISTAIVLLIMSTSSFERQARAELTAAEALDGYKKYLRSIRSVSFEAESVARAIERSELPATGLRQKWHLDFDARRAWRKVEQFTPGSQQDDDIEAAEMVMSSTRAMEVAVDQNSNEATDAFGFHKTPENYWPNDLGLGILSFPFGYTEEIPPRYLPDLITSPKIEQEGRTIRIVESNSKYDLTISLSQDKGWMPEAIKYKLHNESTMVDGTVFEFRYSVETSKEIDGIWLPASYQCNSKIVANLPTNAPIADTENGPVRLGAENSAAELPADALKAGGRAILVTPQPVGVFSIEAQVSLDEIKFNSATDEDFEITAKIPDGTTVTMEDAPQLEFAWLDGKVVPRTEAVSNLASEAHFKGGPKSSRFWLIIITLMIILILAGLTARKWSGKTAR